MVRGYKWDAIVYWQDPVTCTCASEIPVEFLAEGVKYVQAKVVVNKYNKSRVLPANTYAVSMEHGCVDPESWKTKFS